TAEASAAPWLVVGLGNPGPEYANTRHNLGARVVTLLAERFGERLKKSRNRAQVAELRDGDQRVVLARPDGYMNESGGPASLLARYYKVPVDRIVIVYDDIDLAEGKLQVRRGGGTAGHNGIKDVVKALSSPDFYRVRLGVGRPPGRQDPADYVLAPIPKRLAEDLGVLVERGADAVMDVIRLPLAEAQNRNNG
ncbi:MAG TPA: aminoacyl-tRNA hydrolase, partial [Actinomycetes bacterium]